LVHVMPVTGKTEVFIFIILPPSENGLIDGKSCNMATDYCFMPMFLLPFFACFLIQPI